jgi:hypothetical protein
LNISFARGFTGKAVSAVTLLCPVALAGREKHAVELTKAETPVSQRVAALPDHLIAGRTSRAQNIFNEQMLGAVARIPR